MSKREFTYLVLFALISVIFISWIFTRIENDDTQLPPIQTRVISDPPLDKINLPVPFVGEAPDGVWTGSWKNACEEASIAMIEKFYKGEHDITIIEAKRFMQTIFDAENALYGSDKNSDASRTLSLINSLTSFKGIIKENPTIEDIKNELRNGHPVISFHYGFDLENKNIPFKIGGSAFHAMVIRGYNDATGQFITNDDGDLTDGMNYPYSYGLLMKSLHDYDYATDTTDGPPRVIFTSPK